MKLGKSLGVQIPFGSNSNSPIGRALQTLYTPDKIDYTAYGCLIQHCSDQHLALPAKQLHARLFLFSVTSDNFLASKLVSFYSKTNHLCGARYVFDKIPWKNVFSWNAMLIGYSHQSMHHEALQFFSSLAFSNDIDHDRYNITCVLKAMSSLFSDSQSAKVVHCFILRRGLDLDIFVLNALITYYSRCEELGLARAVFDRMPQRDLVPWNAMIAGYSQSGFYVECKQLYKHMLDVRGPRPNGVTLVSVLQACGQSKDLILGMEVHRLITDRGIQMDASICNTLIALYAKCGSLDYARELFEGMNEKDEVTYGSLVSGYMAYGFVGKAMDVFRELKMPALSTWNAVISGLCQNKQLEQAIDLVREMQARGFRVNTVTISSILPIFSQLSYLREAKSIHAYAVKHSYNRNIYVATAIIDTYAKLGFIHGAKCVFDQAEGRSLVIWTSIITAYGGHGDANVALSLFYKMIDDGIHPDGVTFTAILTACAHAGLVDEAWKIFNGMYTKHGIQPLVEQYACMVSVLSRAGKLSEAAGLISEMPFEPNGKVWGALLNGASVCGDVEMGELAFDHLFNIEPENTGNYILMANLYSQAGRWKEADEVREMMDRVGLKKLTGSSWIEKGEVP